MSDKFNQLEKNLWMALALVMLEYYPWLELEDVMEIFTSFYHSEKSTAEARLCEPGLGA